MRPTWAEIRLDRLVENYFAVKQYVGDAVQVMAVLKADAYGHGAVEAALCLERHGADQFGVALVEEGCQLRQAGVGLPILCLGGFWQRQQAQECLELDLTPTVYHIDMLKILEEVALKAGRKLAYHLKVDTGMGRLGVRPEQLTSLLDYAVTCRAAVLEGVYTHFAAADEPERDQETAAQIRCYEACLKLIEQRLGRVCYRHLSNSAGLHRWPRARGNMVRTGGLIYGLWRDVLAPSPPPPAVKPVLSLHSRIILIKEVPAGTPLGYGATFVTKHRSLIATIPIGYDDGWRRACSNNSRVIVRQRYAPVVGRVSMDLTLLDVTDIPGVKIGDEVVLIGEMGDVSITAEEVAGNIDTISYEITCGISKRVPRVYKTGSTR
ncbi:MAG: alanine racemase [Acidobacteriota bacterium]|nr:alanine racemase [Blastocatellia bacterium]MDW8413568.1 alanine racemase [Acidobacteriota bacterium]